MVLNRRFSHKEHIKLMNNLKFLSTTLYHVPSHASDGILATSTPWIHQIGYTKDGVIFHVSKSMLLTNLLLTKDYLITDIRYYLAFSKKYTSRIYEYLSEIAIKSEKIL